MYADASDPRLKPRWDVQQRGGPVLATAVHAGHAIRDELRPYLAISQQDQRREEDPLTGIWSTVGDDAFRCYNSRFQLDLNRARDTAVYRRPEDSWGLKVWRELPPEEMIERSLDAHDDFYAMMADWIEALIDRCGKVLVLDIHSYNHRRDGAEAEPAPQEENPDIDLGVTTLDQERFGPVLEALQAELEAKPAGDRELDVRRNVRYPDGGHWPEWIFANYGDDVATVTLEYKKFYMNEWSGDAHLPVVEDLRAGLDRAAGAAREALERL
jgi:N-formylglutamate deformylase